MAVTPQEIFRRPPWKHGLPPVETPKSPQVSALLPGPEILHTPPVPYRVEDTPSQETR